MVPVRVVSDDSNEPDAAPACEFNPDDYGDTERDGCKRERGAHWFAQKRAQNQGAEDLCIVHDCARFAIFKNAQRARRAGNTMGGDAGGLFRMGGHEDGSAKSLAAA